MRTIDMHAKFQLDLTAKFFSETNLRHFIEILTCTMQSDRHIICHSILFSLKIKMWAEYLEDLTMGSKGN